MPCAQAPYIVQIGKIVEVKICMYILGYYMKFLICKHTIGPPSRQEMQN